MPRIKSLDPVKAASFLDEAYYSPKSLAKLLSISVSTLRWYRESGRGPEYIKMGHRTIRYPCSIVARYLEEKIHRSTSQEPLNNRKDDNMLIPLSEVEFINQLHTSPRSQFVEMDESAYHELICKIERVLHWVRNARTLRPVLVSTNVIQEIA